MGQGVESYPQDLKACGIEGSLRRREIKESRVTKHLKEVTRYVTCYKVHDKRHEFRTLLQST